MNTPTSLRAFQRTFRHTFEQALRSHHAPFRVTKVPLSARTFGVATFRNQPFLAPRTTNTPRRYQSTESEAPYRPLTDRDAESAKDGDSAGTSSADEIALRKALSPAYQLWFTCKKCLERSGHTVSKQAYHYGTCVINCPKCKSQHLISDNLKIFSDTNLTMEDIAKQHGEKLKKGKLGADGDIEFYDEEAEAKIEEKIDNMIKYRPKA